MLGNADWTVIGIRMWSQHHGVSSCHGAAITANTYQLLMLLLYVIECTYMSVAPMTFKDVKEN